MKKLIYLALFLPFVATAEGGKLSRNNIFSIMMGYGADNKVDVEQVGGVANVKASKGPLPGVQYQHIFVDEVVVGGGLFLNGTLFGAVGLKF